MSILNIVKTISELEEKELNPFPMQDNPPRTIAEMSKNLLDIENLDIPNIGLGKS